MNLKSDLNTWRVVSPGPAERVTKTGDLLNQTTSHLKSLFTASSVFCKPFRRVFSFPCVFGRPFPKSSKTFVTVALSFCVSLIARPSWSISFISPLSCCSWFWFAIVDSSRVSSLYLPTNIRCVWWRHVCLSSSWLTDGRRRMMLEGENQLMIPAVVDPAVKLVNCFWGNGSDLLLVLYQVCLPSVWPS